MSKPEWEKFFYTVLLTAERISNLWQNSSSIHSEENCEILALFYSKCCAFFSQWSLIEHFHYLANKKDNDVQFYNKNKLKKSDQYFLCIYNHRDTFKKATEEFSHTKHSINYYNSRYNSRHELFLWDSIQSVEGKCYQIPNPAKYYIDSINQYVEKQISLDYNDMNLMDIIFQKIVNNLELFRKSMTTYLFEKILKEVIDFGQSIINDFSFSTKVGKCMEQTISTNVIDTFTSTPTSEIESLLSLSTTPKDVVFTPHTILKVTGSSSGALLLA
jgi:hypothetical protein